jgi:HSP20 family protein
MERKNQNASLVPQRRQQGLSPYDERDWFGPAFGGSPCELMRRMREDMDRAFGQFFTPFAFAGRGGEQGPSWWRPNVDNSEDENEWTIEIDLPGVDRDNVNVEIDHSQLRIRAEMRQEQNQPSQDQQEQQNQQGQQGWQQPSRQYHQRERSYGYFERTFALPENVDEENVRCDFRNGVLVCHLPKTEQTNYRGRRIPIGEGSQAAIQGQNQPNSQAQTSTSTSQKSKK